MFRPLGCPISFSLRALGKPWRLWHSHPMATCWRWRFSSLHNCHHIYCLHTHQSLRYPPCQLLFIVFTATTAFQLSPNVIYHHRRHYTHSKSHPIPSHPIPSHPIQPHQLLCCPSIKYFLLPWFSSYWFCTHHWSTSVVKLSLNKMSRWPVMTELCTCSSSRRQVFAKQNFKR